MTEPTKGPYALSADRREILTPRAYALGAYVLARICGWMKEDEADANAWLFAASWDLLAACRRVIEVNRHGMTAEEGREAVAMCEAAVAKADGATP